MEFDPQEMMVDLQQLNGQLYSNDFTEIIQGVEPQKVDYINWYRDELSTEIQKIVRADYKLVESHLIKVIDPLGACIRNIRKDIDEKVNPDSLGIAMIKIAPYLDELLQGVEVQLTPKYYLDGNWETNQELSPQKRLFSPGIFNTPADEMEAAIQAIRIEIASKSDTRRFGGDPEFDYYVSEVGMNIVVPKGQITELRFELKLVSDGLDKDACFAVDGCPNNSIEDKYLLSGSIKLCLDSVLKMVPFVGQAIQFNLDPWEFKFGKFQNVNISFSGGLSAHLTWYYTAKGISNNARVSMTLKKPKGVNKVKAYVTAKWQYDPGFFNGIARFSSDQKMVQII